MSIGHIVFTLQPQFSCYTLPLLWRFLITNTKHRSYFFLPRSKDTHIYFQWLWKCSFPCFSSYSLRASSYVLIFFSDEGLLPFTCEKVSATAIHGNRNFAYMSLRISTKFIKIVSHRRLNTAVICLRLRTCVMSHYAVLFSYWTDQGWEICGFLGRNIYDYFRIFIKHILRTLCLTITDVLKQENPIQKYNVRLFTANYEINVRKSSWTMGTVRQLLRACPGINKHWCEKGLTNIDARSYHAV